MFTVQDYKSQYMSFHITFIDVHTYHALLYKEQLQCLISVQIQNILHMVVITNIDCTGFTKVTPKVISMTYNGIEKDYIEHILLLTQNMLHKIFKRWNLQYLFSCLLYSCL